MDPNNLRISVKVGALITMVGSLGLSLSLHGARGLGGTQRAYAQMTGVEVPHARAVVGTATADVEQSGEVVSQAVNAMGGMERSSGQTGQIVGVIDEIEFQANLLAVDAGVEAARPGDALRGFAVVASEVRAPAQRSAAAATETNTSTATSATHARQGVDLVGRTGQAPGRILTQVGEINGVVGDVAASAHHRVNAPVNQMGQMTRQHAATVGQGTAASHWLSTEADELLRLTGRFQLGRHASVGGRASNVAASWRPERKVVPVSVVAGPSKSQPSVAHHRGGGTARKLVPAAAEEGWQEC